ncbi:MAG TPA: MBL fold metallo-hydrolase [bacterium]|nr:MBL fold metallo-hydrolase [bacterium]
MNVIRVVSDGFGENTYVVTTPEGIIIIDPGTSLKTIRKEAVIKEEDIKYVLLTHGHYDHITCIDEYEPGKIYAHTAEKKLLENPSINLSAMAGEGISARGINYYEGDVHETDPAVFYHVPGHTAGCVVIKIGSMLFTGDTLFFDTVGRTDLPTGSTNRLKESLKVFEGFDRSITCYPGHGEEFTLEEAYKTNYFLKKP